MEERLENCQKWLDNALALLEDMGDKKMSGQKYITHLAAVEEQLRQVKCVVSELQSPFASNLGENKPVDWQEAAAENDRLAREGMKREMMEAHFKNR